MIPDRQGHFRQFSLDMQWWFMYKLNNLPKVIWKYLAAIQLKKSIFTFTYSALVFSNMKRKNKAKNKNKGKPMKPEEERN